MCRAANAGIQDLTGYAWVLLDSGLRLRHGIEPAFVTI